MIDFDCYCSACLLRRVVEKQSKEIGRLRAEIDRLKAAARGAR